MSNQVVARFLGETLVSSQFVADDAERSRMLTTIEQRAEQVRRQYADAAHLRANLLHALGRACVAVEITGMNSAHSAICRRILLSHASPPPSSF